MQRLSLDLVRRSNLSLVLRLVHQDRALSRAAITRATGLSRSTVGALISDLAAADLVRERDPEAPSQVGRPSAVVAASPSIAVAAVEISPTRTVLALGGLGGAIFVRRVAETTRPPTPEQAAKISAELLADATAALEHPVRLFGLTAAVVGRVDPDDRVVVTCSELDWYDVAFADLLTEQTGKPATVCYRTQLAATAERTWGAARDIDNLVYLHGAAAGIGGVVIADGERLRGAFGLAARVGHLFVGGDLELCVCGERGCLMAVVTEHHLLAALRAERPDLSGLSDQALLDRAAGEESAVPPAGPSAGVVAGVVDRDLHHLQIALRTMMVAYDPDAIVLGGFLAGLLRLGGARLADGLSSSGVTHLRPSPRLLEPTLGADQVLSGAVHRGFIDLLDDPLGCGAASLPFE